VAMGRTMAYDGTAGNTVDGGARGTGPVLQPPVLKPLPPTPGAAPNILNTHNTEKGARILNGHVLGNRTATRPFPEEKKTSMRVASVLVACAAVAVASAGITRIPIYKRELTLAGVMGHAIRGEVERRSVRGRTDRWPAGRGVGGCALGTFFHGLPRFVRHTLVCLLRSHAPSHLPSFLCGFHSAACRTLVPSVTRLLTTSRTRRCGWRRLR
jgi:hypothetical protein